MHSLFDYLKDEHEHCDADFVRTESAVAAQRWDDALAAHREFEAGHAAHLSFEEDKLFPELDRHSGMMAGPTDVMRREHGQLRRLLAAMGEALRTHDSEAFYEQADLFRVMNHQHNQKEENMLYPMADKLLGTRGVAMLQVARDLQHGGQGCACARAAREAAS
ncbi:MAG TPA: hemerythrin domain-containing protein [Burkholderiaceae bacterium]